jgi:hypothetical protein
MEDDWFLPQVVVADSERSMNEEKVDFVPSKK